MKKIIAKLKAANLVVSTAPKMGYGAEYADLLVWDEYRKTVFNTCRLIAEPFRRGNVVQLRTGQLITDMSPMGITHYVAERK